MKVKIKKTHEEAVIPKYAKRGDACMDLYAVNYDVDSFGNHVYDTGIAIEIPDGYVGLVFPRSSISKTFDMNLRSSVGVIDSGYRGSIILKFSGSIGRRRTYGRGDRIGQIMILPYPKIVFEEVRELSDSERGSGGFGSTGS